MKPRHPVWSLLDRLQMDLRDANAKLVELRSLVASLHLEAIDSAPAPTCGVCGVGAGMHTADCLLAPRSGGA